MIRRVAAIVVAALALAPAAPAGWQWRLPSGIAPPTAPADNPMSAAKIMLGRRLFYDADLSIDGTMACATCHEQKRGFADGNRTHAGVHGDPGRRNVPGLANVGWMRSLTWANPRITTLEAHVAVPVFGTAPVEMGMAGREAEVVDRLGRDACYRRLFARAFPDRRHPIAMAQVAAALAAFQRTLVALDTPYDRGQLSAAARAGAALFAGPAGCATCHAGPNLSDGDFHAVGTATAQDRGLAEVTGRATDEGRFRTPGLRNVAVTAPYLHDGSATTLAHAIARHAGPQDPGHEAALVAFLESLTDTRFLTDPSLGYPERACR